MAERPVTVQINNVTYSINGEGSEEHILSVAALVNRRIDELKQRHSYYPTAKLLTLTALQLADELVKLEAEYAALLEETELK